MVISGIESFFKMVMWYQCMLNHTTARGSGGMLLEEFLSVIIGDFNSHCLQSDCNCFLENSWLVRHF